MAELAKRSVSERYALTSSLAGINKIPLKKSIRKYRALIIGNQQMTTKCVSQKRHSFLRYMEKRPTWSEHKRFL